MVLWVWVVFFDCGDLFMWLVTVYQRYVTSSSHTEKTQETQRPTGISLCGDVGNGIWAGVWGCEIGEWAKNVSPLRGKL